MMTDDTPDLMKNMYKTQHDDKIPDDAEYSKLSEHVHCFKFIQQQQGVMYTFLYISDHLGEDEETPPIYINNNDIDHKKINASLGTQDAIYTLFRLPYEEMIDYQIYYSDDNSLVIDPQIILNKKITRTRLN